MIEIFEEKIIKLALLEDLAFGDITTNILIDAQCEGKGILLAREDFVLAGSETFINTFKLLTDSAVPEIVFLKKDGDSINRGEIFARIEGNMSALLRGERTALNFLQHLSGIATLTALFTKIAFRYGVSVLDTRKTIPGLRYLEKKAVLAGKGKNHRFSLSDGILIKDNHIVGCGGNIKKVLEKIKDNVPHLGKVEIEVKTLDELRAALEMGVDVIMLDNMNTKEIKSAVALVNKKAVLEISGGVNMDNFEEKVKTGVDAISIGALTHSARAVDISMNIEVIS